MPSPEEQADLDILLNKIKDQKIKGFEYAEYCLRMTPTDCTNAGYKNVSHAVVSAIRNAINEIQKLTKEHIKKYPDRKEK